MPELPEVETIVRDLAPELVGRRILRARLSHDDVLRGTTRRRLTAGLAKATIEAVTRRAKHAVLTVGSRRLVVQPGMTGALLVQPEPLSAEDSKYAVLRAWLDDGRILIYHDVRRLGTLLLLDDKGWQEYDAALGPEPLDADLDIDALVERMRRSRQSIKKVLMDQRIIVGVGNIYANEALFAARIDPSRAASKLTEGECRTLIAETQRILRNAIAGRGSTIRDYRTGTGEAGGFQQSHLVYGRGGEPCVNCGTRLTETHLIDGRTTVLCHNCQR